MDTSTPNTMYLIVAQDGSFLQHLHPTRRLTFDTLDEARQHLNSFYTPSNYRIAVVNFLPQD